MNPPPFFEKRRSKKALVLIVAMMQSAIPLHAANYTWLGGGADGQWSDAANWTGIPGATTGTTNQDDVYFNSNLSNALILNDAGRNIRSIYFGVNTGSYTIGQVSGPALRLSSGGTIENLGSTSAIRTQTIDASLILEAESSTGNGHYTIANKSNASSSTNRSYMIINGGISGGTTTGKISLTLDGINSSTESSMALNAINGVISDGGAAGGVDVTKNGTGSIVLRGSNTFSGGFVMNAGTVYIGNDSAFGTGTLTYNGGTILGGGGRTLLNDIVWNNTLTLQNQNGLVFKGAVSLGTAAGTERTFSSNSGVITMDGVISNGVTANSIRKTGAGNLKLGNANTFTGGVTVESGQLAIAHNNALGTGKLIMLGGRLSGTATIANHQEWRADFAIIDSSLVLSGSISLGTAVEGSGIVLSRTNGAALVSGVIADASGKNYLVKSGTGALALSGSNTFSGGFTLAEGILQIRNTHALGTGTVTINGGLINNDSGADLALLTNNKQVWGGNFSFNSTSLHAFDMGTGDVLLTGDRTVFVRNNTLSVGGVISDGDQTYGLTTGSNGTLTLYGNNTYKGTTTISAGTLRIGAGGSTGTLGRGAVINNASLIVNRAGTYELDNNISGSGTVRNQGAGLVVLSGSNSYGGATTVENGVVRLASANALPGGIINGVGTANLNLSGGVIELTATSGNFTRALGTGATQVQIGAAGGGFSAYGSDRVVNLGAAGDTLTWGGTGWDAAAKLMLSSNYANASVDFQNGVNLNGATQRTIAVANGSAEIDAKLSGIISNTNTNDVGGIRKEGAGTLLITGANTYKGATSVAGGGIIVGNAQALGGSVATVDAGAWLKVDSSVSGFANGIHLNGGTFIYNGSSHYTAPIGFVSGVLKGSGTFGGYVELNDVEQILSPGDSGERGVGIMTFSGSSPYWSAFTYEWNLESFEGTTAGVDFSQVNIEDGLSLDSEGTYVLKISSVLAGGELGDLSDFTETSRSWSILTATYGIYDFDATLWQIDSSGFSALNGWTGNWTVSLSNDETSLMLNYTVVPEPGHLYLLGGGVVFFALLGRRRKKALAAA